MPSLSALAIALLLAQAAAAPPPPAGPPAPAVDPMLDNPAITEINRLLEPWKGKRGDSLRGKLGLSYSTKTASDGEAVFRIQQIESLGCGVIGGAMRCGPTGGAECVLAIGFDKQGAVKTWKVKGSAEPCGRFVPLIAGAALPPA